MLLYFVCFAVGFTAKTLLDEYNQNLLLFLED